MAKAQSTPAPQQQGSAPKPAGQMGATDAPAPQQVQAPVIRDWASI